MRLISFALTTDQFLARTKTVTRRLGWARLDVGDQLMGCRQCQGLKPGESVERLGAIRVVAVTRGPLAGITPEDVAREGFPGMDPAGFVAMFCRAMGCSPEAIVTRIEFEYLDEPKGPAGRPSVPCPAEVP